MSVTVSLSSYPTIPSVTVNFNAIINACVITSLTIVTGDVNANTPTINYVVSSPSTILPTLLPAFDQVPSCGYTVSVTATVQPWLTLTATHWEVNSSDFALIGTAPQISFTGTAASSPTFSSAAVPVNVAFALPSCDSSYLNTQTLADMTTTVSRATVESQTFTYFTDYFGV